LIFPAAYLNNPSSMYGHTLLRIDARDQDEKTRLLAYAINYAANTDETNGILFALNGLIGGYTGEGAKTVIPGQATAKVSFRLVGTQDPKKVRDAFRKFVRERLPADAKAEFSNFALAPPIQLPFDNPALLKARAALAAEWGRKAVTVGEGGSIPIVADFKRVLGMDTLMVGFALDDDRVHSPNEKYDLTSFHKGTRSWARILAALAG